MAEAKDSGDSARQEGNGGFDSAKDMAALVPSQDTEAPKVSSAGEFLSELAKKTDSPVLMRNLTQGAHEMRAQPRLWYGDDEAPDGNSQARVSEASMRSCLTSAVHIATEYLVNPSAGLSPTIMDLEQGNEFDAVQRDYLFRILGVDAYQAGETVPDERQPDRFRTTIYPTNIHGFELQAWEHTSKPKLQDDGTDMAKYSLRRTA